MKASHSFVFFILIVIVIGGVFSLINKYNSHQTKTLRSVVGCFDEVIDDSILNLEAETTLFRAFITFQSMPLSNEDSLKLNNLNIVLETDSQIFEISPNIIAQIPTTSLCELAKLESVQNIFIPN